MFHRFRYEAKYYRTLSRVPLHVRMKLDLAGAKISLADWLAFDFAERKVLCHLPCASDEEKAVFTAYLNFLSRKYRGLPVAPTEALDSSLWEQAAVPEPVRAKSAESNGIVTPKEWLGWQSPQRYALYKTAVSKSQPEAFADVLDELRHAKKIAAEADG